MAGRTLRLLYKHGGNVGQVDIAAAEVALERDWLGPGYGHSTPAADQAAALFAEREENAGPKAAAALLELNRRGAFGPGPVLYWHTYSRPQDG